MLKAWRALIRQVVTERFAIRRDSVDNPGRSDQDGVESIDMGLVFDRLCSVLWQVKEGNTDVSVVQMARFCEGFHTVTALPIDALNSLVYYRGTVSAEEADEVVRVLREVNGGRYDRMVVDTLLMLMEHESALAYLREIAKDESSMSRFCYDFPSWPDFENDRLLIFGG
jgi:hypothetical protein